MSAEAFSTVLSCDMRTAPDGRSAEYAPGGTGRPRWHDRDPVTGDSVKGGWADCHAYAEQAVRIAAQAVRDEQMAGLTGDHPEKREQAARILEATADLVRGLALDAACDGTLADARWQDALNAVVAAAQGADHAGQSASGAVCESCRSLIATTLAGSSR